MLKGIITLLIFQFIGECISRLFSLLVPGAVIGMILLLVFLIIRKKSFHSLDTTVSFFLKYLPLLFIPAAMGIITQVDTISKEFLAISISLFIGTVLSLALSAKILDYFANKESVKNEF
ncbi:CidA/LrgA family protein [Arcobacter sp. F2176]|uniref:CidA/LrgA family protein n=1 Tax=Arcobacter sp. F2176 TaxID=2044511 RepID=UPI00100BBB8C|nr:CidA/LrgA family protein [Arcobacter sp. F2176]RXJ80174.1 hypothetical protein CRU95_11880 [Arcobacter sp. F2176]